MEAQLPARRAFRLAELGHDAVDTSSLPDGNGTTGQQDADFATAPSKHPNLGYTGVSLTA